jgi:hypothetical protein
MSAFLETLFPGLRTTAYRVTSPPTGDYNCIAWAAGDTSNWWWPINDPSDTPRYWPGEVPREETMAAFLAVFAGLGYTVCESEIREIGYEKVALFVSQQRAPTHAARQLPDGLWTSKLGRGEDIEHELRALEGDIYGTVVGLLKRPWAS